METYEKIDVSIIIPLYKGNKYIDALLTQIDDCINNTDATVEVIFVNDYPIETISDLHSENFNVHLINNKTNLGIHASRINGLYASKGEYVLFLDQDDYIRPDYIKKQLNCVGDADAVVCKLLNGDKQYYTDSFKFKEVITKKFMLNKWCPIVSPGQVLVKRTSIPKIWKKNVISSNGADDYFLWLAMLGKGMKFTLNDEILFEHRITGINTSLDTNKMMDSEHEMLQVLRNNNDFSEFDNLKLFDLEISLRKIHIKQLDNLSMAYLVLKTLCLTDTRKIRKCFGTKVAIYGAADIGQAFFQGIAQNNDVKLCFIDRNAEYISLKVPVYKLDSVPKDIETIIIAVNGNVDGIRKEIIKKYTCKVLSISEALNLLTFQVV